MRKSEGQGLAILQHGSPKTRHRGDPTPRVPQPPGHVVNETTIEA